ncbi:hypothetical protein D3C78_453170 [compost metagenome]
MHALALHRRADEITVRLEGPTVIDAFVNLGITAISSANAHAAVRADVKGHVDFTVLAPSDDYGVGPHIAYDEVTRVGNFRLVP